jgi:hypothetical protein
MGEGRIGGLGRVTFATIVVAIGALVLAQSVVHLVVVLRLDRVGTFVDLDRSNGLPDLVSTCALLLATAGAVALAGRETGTRWRVGAALAGLLAVLCLADLFHDGAHPSSAGGWYVIALVLGAAVLLGLVGRDAGARPKATLVTAALVLVGSFLVNGLDRADHWFQRARGDAVAEYQIVAKEGLELLGWSLVALALWDEALRLRRSLVSAPTARASRAPAPSRRRAA